MLPAKLRHTERDSDITSYRIREIEQIPLSRANPVQGLFAPARATLAPSIPILGYEVLQDQGTTAPLTK